MSIADLVRPQGFCWKISIAADAQPHTMAVATHLRIAAVVLLLAQQQAADTVPLPPVNINAALTRIQSHMAGSKQGSAEHSAAVAGFEALGICQQLAEAAVALGWKEPTSIQQQALPHLLQGAAMLRKRSAPDTPVHDLSEVTLQAEMSLALHRQAQARQEPLQCPSCR